MEGEGKLLFLFFPTLPPLICGLSAPNLEYVFVVLLSHSIIDFPKRRVLSAALYRAGYPPIGLPSPRRSRHRL